MMHASKVNRAGGRWGEEVVVKLWRILIHHVRFIKQDHARGLGHCCAADDVNELSLHSCIFDAMTMIRL